MKKKAKKKKHNRFVCEFHERTHILQYNRTQKTNNRVALLSENPVFRSNYNILCHSIMLLYPRQKFYFEFLSPEPEFQIANGGQL